MSELTDGPYRGAVVYADFSELRPNQIVDAPLNFNEVRELAMAASKLHGLVMESTPRKLHAFFQQPQQALEVARLIQTKISQVKDADISRLGLDARVIIGFGSVVIEQARVRSDWTFRLAGLVSAVPQNSIGALREFVAQFPAGAIDPPPRPSARTDLFVLPMPGGLDQDTRLAVDRSTAGEGAVFLTLTLRVRGVPMTLRSSDCPILVGRDKSCAVQISGETASRVHGRIEFEKDKFYYVDDSRNGTYVLTGSGQEILLKHEKIALVGEGAISPGAPLSKQSGEVVRFSCTPSRLSLAGDKPGEGDTKPMR